MSWADFRWNLQEFASLANANIDPGHDFNLAEKLEHGIEGVVTTRGISADFFSLMLCWRVACWPFSTTLLVTPKRSQAQLMVLNARRLMAEADDDLRSRVWFTPNSFGMTTQGYNNLSVAHTYSGTMGIAMEPTKNPRTFIIPDFDQLNKAHASYISLLGSRPGTLVIANIPSRGRLS